MLNSPTVHWKGRHFKSLTLSHNTCSDKLLKIRFYEMERMVQYALLNDDTSWFAEAEKPS